MKSVEYCSQPWRCGFTWSGGQDSWLFAWYLCPVEALCQVVLLSILLLQNTALSPRLITF